MTVKTVYILQRYGGSWEDYFEHVEGVYTNIDAVRRKLQTMPDIRVATKNGAFEGTHYTHCEYSGEYEYFRVVEVVLDDYSENRPTQYDI